MGTMKRFSLTLFSTNSDVIRRAAVAGVDEVIVDWEFRGKEERQSGADTEINRNTPDDLRRVRACTDVTVLCRINACGPWTPGEVATAVEAGADEILLPMVRSCAEVEAVMKQVDGRCGLGILVETIGALSEAESLAALPLSRVYVGLNDLAIQRGHENIFTALVDGTVERIRRPFSTRFGFGGLTLPDCGHPIPCRLLMGEMARLDCDFSFLRRSFRKDIQGRDMAVEIPRLLDAIKQSRLRVPEAVAQDRRELQAAVRTWPYGSARQQEFLRNV
jgi:2-keto-3-deoxy-L-rhamnonate aldolase RhmA